LFPFTSGRRLTPQGTRDLDRIAGQVRSCLLYYSMSTWNTCGGKKKIRKNSGFKNRYWFGQVMLLKLNTVQ